GGKGKIAVVHNGIIENYKQIKEFLEQKGVVFASQTDSEVIAQLAEYYYYGDIMDTVVRVSNRLEGSYALGILCADDPDTLIAVKKDNPLIIGVSEHGNFIASDVPAVLKYTDRVHYLGDHEIAVLTKAGVSFFNMDLDPLEKAPETVSWTLDSAEKGGYPHFMLKEIFEQPKILKETIQSAVSVGENKNIIDAFDITRFNKVLLIGCGSAYNAGVVAKYAFEKLCGLPCIETDLASEFRYRNAVVDKKTLVILVSQSGETADTIAAMREAKARGAVTLSIVNVVGSAIAKESDYCLKTLAGPEIAVATTKAFSAQLALLYILAVRFAVGLGKLLPEEGRGLLAEIAGIPAKISDILSRQGDIQKFAVSAVSSKSIFFIGRNIDYAVCLEGSLKLKEISYVHSEAYAGGELKHGTISLIEDDTLVVAISTCKRLYGKIMSNVEQVQSRGAKVLLIGNAHKTDAGENLSVVELPGICELFSPSLSVIVLQLFAYYVAANKGLDIDKPRNLAKSVTVE
ncbi:MAG: glutamine--fructose-6-phosphate transaminase (isomerizing), partial [Firmicutes bacterium]|nr:glutamine--fructose-6-phosphate transaminase (isomerizing) [Bacillota bacterium]